MESKNQFRIRFAGIAVGVLAALLIWPATRWLVRTQASCLVPGPSSAWAAASGLNGAGAGEVARWTHAAARTMPDDFAVQLADSVSAGQSPTFGPDEKVANLRLLAQRFPNRPSLYANILRFATGGPVMVRRNEEIQLVAGAPDNTITTHTDPAAAAAYDRDAAEGERLDPENAYFPVMRAVGLFARFRDAEALAALHRAARKPQWIEYYDDELDGEIKLQDRVFGNSGALPRVGFFVGILFPHYAQIRGVGRMATVLAMRAEMAGKGEQGLAIREDLMRCGGLIRAEARTLIGNLVGSDVAIKAMQRPAGAPVLKEKPVRSPGAGPNAPEHRNAQTGNELRERLVAQYDAYLTKVGHMELSARAHAEADAATEMREVAFKYRDRDVFGATLWQLGISWWMNVQILCAALWMLALGAGAALAYHGSRGLRSGRPLPPCAGRGIALGAIAALLSGVIVLPAARPTTTLWLGTVLVFAILALAWPAPSRADRARTLAAYVGGLVVAGCLLMLFAWHVNATVEPMRKVVTLLMNGGENGQEPVDRGFQMMFMGNSMADLGYHLVTVFAAALVPLLAAFAFWFVSKVNRVPLSVALVRGFRGCAVPIACALLLTYAALLPVTLRLESAADDGIRQSLRHEGRYEAGLGGVEWPGIVP